MSRRRRVIHKEVKKDARYASPVVASLISTVMREGKKSTAERIVYTAIEKTREGTDTIDPLETLNKALENVKPRLEVKSRRVGGATYQVPMEVRTNRGSTLALRWLVHYARTRGGKTMAGKLANEIMDAANETGGTIKKREETHRMAEANKAFAHYRY
jgi:small subunit ribosomal protein S7